MAKNENAKTNPGDTKLACEMFISPNSGLLICGDTTIFFNKEVNESLTRSLCDFRFFWKKPHR